MHSEERGARWRRSRILISRNKCISERSNHRQRSGADSPPQKATSRSSHLIFSKQRGCVQFCICRIVDEQFDRVWYRFKQDTIRESMGTFCIPEILDPFDKLLGDADKVCLIRNHERFLTVDLIENQP